MEARSIQRATLKALAVFLQTQFNADVRFDPRVPDTRVVVSESWPRPGQNLPPRALTVLPAGERRDTHLSEQLVKVTDKPNGQGEFTWSIKACVQPLQLDIWGLNEPARDLVCDGLDRFLNMGPLYTLGAGDITRDGPLLKLDPSSGHESFVDYTFEGPSVVNEPVSISEYQYRSLVRGEAECILTFTATTAKLARIRLKQLLDGEPFNFTLTKSGDGYALSPDDT